MVEGLSDRPSWLVTLVAEDEDETQNGHGDGEVGRENGGVALDFSVLQRLYD